MHKFGGHWRTGSGVHHPHYDLVRKSRSKKMYRVNQYYSAPSPCHGIFLMREPDYRKDKWAEHNEPNTHRRIKGTNQAWTRMKGIEGDAKKHETMLPIFRNAKKTGRLKPTPQIFWVSRSYGCRRKNTKSICLSGIPYASKAATQ